MKKNDKQRLFEVMSKVDKSFKPKLNEISTGSAIKAHDITMRDKWSSDNPSITQRKASNQMQKFANYINPELKKYVMQKFDDIEGFEMYKGHEKEVILKFPIVGQQGIESVEIHVLAESYEVFKNVQIKHGTRYVNDKIKGGEELLSEKYISILPTIVKRIQADLRGEKSMFNPEKSKQPEPIQQPEPVNQNSQPEVQKKSSGILNKIFNI